jgi:hypothetical protein
VALAVILLLPFAVCFSQQAVEDAEGSLLKVNYRNLVSRADLTYQTPASRSEEGMPIGNGRMGSLVWTTPSALKFQINRVDVFAADASSVSFPKADSDYGSSCGYVDMNLVDAGEDVFEGKNFRQHLSVYDGLMTVQGKGVTARLFALHGRDVLAIEIDDQRKTPSAVNIDLRMLRYAIECIYNKSYELARTHAVTIRTAEHMATSQLRIQDGRIILTQEYREHQYYNASAVAIQVVGRPSKARYLNESTVQLSAAPGRGNFTILIASAASFDEKQNIAELALKELDAAADRNFAQLFNDNTAWWSDFWSYAQRRRTGGLCRTELHVLSLFDGFHLSWKISSSFWRIALQHDGRYAEVGISVLVGEHQRLLQQFHAIEPDGSDGAHVLSVQWNVCRVQLPHGSNGARRGSGFQKSWPSTGWRNFPMILPRSCRI